MSKLGFTEVRAKSRISCASCNVPPEMLLSGAPNYGSVARATGADPPGRRGGAVGPRRIMMPPDALVYSNAGGGVGLAMFVEEPPQGVPIRVCLRLRPLNIFELKRRSTRCVTSAASSYGADGGMIVDMNNAPHATIGENTINIHSPLEGGIQFRIRQGILGKFDPIGRIRSRRVSHGQPCHGGIQLRPHRVRSDR